MIDVAIAGAGPAGSFAAIILARAGARVVMLDRDAFPRDKLCGDTINPGAVARLASHDLIGGPLSDAHRLYGMRVTGPAAGVEARYAGGHYGLILRRRDLDAWLLAQAIAAGAKFEPHLEVRAPLLGDPARGPLVRGLIFARRGRAQETFRMPALLTIAADGRRSRVARALRLTSHPSRPRRWAFGTYASGIAGLSDLGEMHLRAGHYVGIAPFADGRANVCVVTGPRPEGHSPLEVIQRVVERDPRLAPRFAEARFDAPVGVLGPLAVDCQTRGASGLMLAGDAGGFVDPMTGDGLHLALQSAEMAAAEALAALAQGAQVDAALRLSAAWRRQAGRKIAFNRLLRRLSGSDWALRMAARGARIAPGLVRRAVSYAGDAG